MTTFTKKIIFQMMVLTLAFTSVVNADEAPAATATLAPVGAEEVKVVRSQSIVPGYYTDSKQGHQLFVKEVIANGFASYYAAIIWKAGFVSLYRIEDVDGSTQAWINLYQDSSNNLSTNINQTATYSVTPLTIDKSLSLRFTWTAYASTIGHNVPCSIIPNFAYQGRSKTWGDFSSIEGGRYQGQRTRKTFPASQVEDKKRSKKTELIISPTPSGTSWNVIATNMILESLNSKEWTNPAINKVQYPEQTIYNGEYIGTELIPGLMLTKRKQLDSMSTSGLSLADEVSMFVIPIVKGKNEISSMHVVRMAPNDVECAYVRSEIKP
jgi:hypothetical protein